MRSKRATTSNSQEVRPPILRVDETLQQQRSSALQALRDRRDPEAVGRALDDLEQAARGDTNLMPRILSAVESSATLGEISDRLRTVFGVHTETFTL